MLKWILTHDIIIISCCLGISLGIIIKVSLVLIEILMKNFIPQIFETKGEQNA